MRGFTRQTVGGLPLITVDAMLKNGCFAAYTTRFGGISPPPYDSLNLSYSESRADPLENVQKNWNVVTTALGCSKEQLVRTRQTHSRNVLYVDRPIDFSAEAYSDGVDGVVTDRPDLLLTVVTADCQSLLFFDPVKGICAAVHSGWRGTLADIGGIAVEKMQQLGSRPSDILVSSGPSIAPCCFEVGEDVVSLFNQRFGKEADRFFTPAQTNGKYMGDMPSFTKMCLVRRGVLPENVHLLPVCTRCNTDFFSHRRQKGQRGTMASLIIGKEWKAK